MKKPVYISSRTNPLVMRVCSLQERKYRDREGLFRFDGRKLLDEALACGRTPEYLILREDRAESILNELGGLAGDAQPAVLSESAFSKISDEKAPEGIISVSGYMKDLHFSEPGVEKLPEEIAGDEVIAVESVQDPGNLGTVIRSAAAFGIDTLIISSDCADVYNPRTLRAAMGAVFSRRIIKVPDLPGALSALAASGRRVIGAALAPRAVDLTGLEIGREDIFVIGNEGHGLSARAVAACGVLTRIPMLTGPGVESLNAAVAASVIMYERTRYR
ncbi:MAG: RNA methyltransferase [Clostridia bacterium]|jgi:TrmH family RNA methyltransferase|nr:RNA methyltransferase [Clostridia bacterium]